MKILLVVAIAFLFWSLFYLIIKAYCPGKFE